MKILNRLMCTPIVSRGDAAYGEAMRSSNELLAYMRDASKSTDAARAIMADVWAQSHNIPFLTTVYESVREMKDAVTQRPEDPPK